MRRAISSCYYAMFHALARQCADRLVGGVHATDPDGAWRRVYRALDHKSAKTAMRSEEAVKLAPSIAAFGEAFALLQEKRHQADYDPAPFPYFYDESTALIELAESAIQGLYSVGQDERRALATLLLFRNR
jgi:hypothetical protein